MIIDIIYSRVRRKTRRKLLALLEILDNENIDKVEEALIAEGMRVLVGNYSSVGAKIPDKAYQAVAKEVVRCLNKTNRTIQLKIKESLN